jgi:predicted acyltransferase
MNRNQSLDALRGFAILAMVLSGSIAFGGILPAWMYHAQVPPPEHKFNPAIAGITWVDLVFPFFLFSMGAAIPLSLKKKETEPGFIEVFLIAARRFALLAFFAFFTQHMKAWVLADVPAVKDHLLSILAFLLLFFQFYEYRDGPSKGIFQFLRIFSFILAVGLLMFLPFKNNTGFDNKMVDIIILVLGNMAFFGTIIWWLTRNLLWLRVGILPFVMAVFLSPKIGWTGAIYNFSPFPWLYKFYYLKYLFIIIPGTFAGEWLLKYGKNGLQSIQDIRKNQLLQTAAVCSVLLIICNVTFLFTRELVINLVVSIFLMVLIGLLIRRAYKHDASLYYIFFKAGAYLLLLGLFFEAYEGGVKKDSSTYSYYLITSGLSFFSLIAFSGLQLNSTITPVINYLGTTGRNPMVAYVAGSLFLLPIMHITGIYPFFNQLNTNAGIGLLRGILFTGIVSLITLFFVRMKWFWKS